jgi:hypothetical protein
VFIGHFAVAFAAKKVSPQTSLGTLVLAAEWIDLLFPVLILLGIEQAGIRPGDNAFLRLDLTRFPVSHSLLAVLGWSLLFFGSVRRRTHDLTAAFVVAAAVFSHWVLDFISHTPDLPLWPGGPLVGLGLWRDLRGTAAVESLMFAGGLWIYFHGTAARDRIGRWGAVALAVFLSLLYVGNVVGPPPTDVKAFAVVGLAAWLFPVWAWWVDRHREPRTH